MILPEYLVYGLVHAGSRNRPDHDPFLAGRVNFSILTAFVYTSRSSALNFPLCDLIWPWYVPESTGYLHMHSGKSKRNREYMARRPYRDDAHADK